jgi:fused signal recognition particle receptor
MKIETRADMLLNIVKEKKKVSFEDCANQLNVSQNLLEKWVQSLEEEGLLATEYEFTTPYIVERVLSNEEEQEKLANMFKKRDFFMQEQEIMDLENKNLEQLEKDIEEDVIEEVKEDKEELREELEEARHILEETGELEEKKILDEIKEEPKETIEVVYDLRKTNMINQLIKRLK